MLYAPESQQMMDRFAGEIEDLRTIAKLHALPIGSSERLQALPLRLAKDVRLRSDLAELVRSLQVRDPDLGLPDVLSLLLVAMGGSPSLEGRRDMEEVVDLMGGFLASIGGWPGSSVEPITDLDHPPDHDPRLDLAASAYTKGLEADLVPQPVSLPQAPVPAAELAEGASSALNGSVTLGEITQALARLERGNLELRLHLDSIDQRICRMEPLLEAVPSSPPADELPPRPEPASTPRPVAREQEPGDLVHRGSLGPERGSVVSEYDLKRQREEEIKAQRRISLSSNFVDPVPEAMKSATAGSLPLQRGVAVALASPIAEPVPEPALRSRPPMPRRDRFAAAREIPGNDADSDPLYTATDEELAEAARASTAQTASTPAPSTVTSDESAAATVLAEKVPVPDEVYREPSPPVVTRQPERLEYLKLDPVTAPAVHPAHSTPQFLTETEEPARRHTGAWIGGVAATAVLGAAGFLYVNGLPSMITEWVSGSRTTASSTEGRDRSRSTGTSPAQNSESAIQAPAGSSRTGAEARSATSAGQVLGARESSSPSTTIEKINGPTFVPGGVMDGYLISAPRPQYPQLANLAGVQGKISFEAMISKAGGVEALKVLGGPQLLRSAATDAVKQWQYRPFEVKGRPVEVRTIIRVDVAPKAGVPADAADQ